MSKGRQVRDELDSLTSRIERLENTLIDAFPRIADALRETDARLAALELRTSAHARPDAVRWRLGPGVGLANAAPWHRMRRGAP